MITGYVKPENLCIAESAFMAFHAVRGMERGNYMENATFHYYTTSAADPSVDQGYGGWQALPMHGFWFMYDRDLWSMGYQRCAS